MARRGENIYHRKDGRWEGRYISGRRLNGKAVFTSVYGKRYQDVRRKLLERKHAGPPPALPAQSFAVRVEYYLEDKLRPSIRPSTYAHYRQMADQHLLPAFSACALEQMTAEDIQRFITGCAGRLSVGTLRNVFGLLRSILRDAYLDGRLHQRIWENVRLPPQRRRAVRVLNLQEQRTLEQAALQNNRLEFILCLYTGVRVGELCALRWSDIDFGASMLHVCRSLQQVQTNGRFSSLIDLPKTDSAVRDIPLQPFLLALLQQARPAGEDGFLFPGRKEPFTGIRTMQARFARLAHALNLHDAHIHTLRHTYATRLLEHGAGIETVSALLGHASPTITLRYYAHSTMQHRIESANALNLLDL